MIKDCNGGLKAAGGLGATGGLKAIGLSEV